MADNKTLVRRGIDELWSQGKLAVADEIVAASYVRHDPSTPGETRGPEGLKGAVGAYREAFPDLTFTIVDMVAEGDKVATRGTARGTHRAPLMGIPATGKQGNVTWTAISRVAGGKIVEEWVNWDALGLMQQLGVVPAMA